MSGSSSDDDEPTFDDDRFNLFADDSVSDDSDLEQLEDDMSTTEDEDRNEPLDYDDGDELMDDDDEVYRQTSYPAPMPWPPAIVANQNQQTDSGSAKKKKPGIIYLSSIPPGFNVAKTISFFSKFGKIGRVFLQPDSKEKTNRRDKISQNFTEGWIEFLSKRVAKDIAANLNNAQVGVSKRSKSHDVIWNMKYLPRFKWTHLSERLAYERSSHTQKMRTEVSEAKRESDLYRSNVDTSKRILKRSNTEMADEAGRMYHFRQKDPESEFLKKKKVSVKKSDLSSEKKKERKKTKEQSPVAVRKTKSKSPNKSKSQDRNSGDVEPPSKRSRTRSSKDRKDFLTNIFGAKN